MTDSTHDITTLEVTSQGMNVDPKEIAKFSAIASRWWDTEGEFKPLHRLNPLRLDYILQRSHGLFAKTVLDVGCGGGILTEGLARQGALVTGLDLASDSLHTARLHAQQENLPINYIEQAVEEHAQNHAEQYDVVTCLEMLEHVPDPASVVCACAKLVKPGGQLFFSTINRNIKAHLLAIVAAEYLLKLVPKGTHDSKKFITPAELTQWLRDNQLAARHITGIHYNPLFGTFRLHEKDVSVNYLLHAQKPD